MPYLQGIEIPVWELNIKFRPLEAIRQKHHMEWTDCKGSPLQSPTKISIKDIWDSHQEGTLKKENIIFRDANSFIAGQLHCEPDNWSFILNDNNDSHSKLVQSWLTGGVDIADYFNHFKGNFRNQSYDSRIPPPTVIPNHASCIAYASEIAEHLEDRIRNGSLQLLGRVGEVPPPTVVMPLVMVPGKKKNRLCHDERLLNLFMKAHPFTLETLKLVPNILPPGAFITNCDEKSAYDGLSISLASRTYFGVEFGGWYMQYTTLPFGWSMSPFIYQTVGMQVTSFLRSKGIITLQYLDDRLIGPIKSSDNVSPKQSTANATALVLATLSSLGYTMALNKSCLEPTQSLTFLGLKIHSDKRQFSIPEEKKLDFKELRQEILSKSTTHIKLLQRLMGKCVSFSLCIAGAKFYIREMAAAVASATKNSKPIAIKGALAEEIRAWQLIDQHPHWLPWRQEKHITITLATDASTFAWGAHVEGVELSDLWPTNDKRPIHIKEADALLKTIEAIGQKLRNCRVEAKVDNMAVVHAWQKEGAKDHNLNVILKKICTQTINLNCDLRLTYIKSEENPADAPSRRLSPNDATMTPAAWAKIETMHGPHSFDLMALDSNAMRDAAGNPLKHYTPYSLPSSSGVDVFAQTLNSTENYYCYPPFCMVGPLIKFIMESPIRPLSVSLVVPLLTPRPFWWPVLLQNATLTLLSPKGDTKTMLMPSKHGYAQRPLCFSLYVARLSL